MPCPVELPRCLACCGAAGRLPAAQYKQQARGNHMTLIASRRRTVPSAACSQPSQVHGSADHVECSAAHVNAVLSNASVQLRQREQRPLGCASAPTPRAATTAGAQLASSTPASALALSRTEKVCMPPSAPMGTTMRPPGASCSTSSCGSRGAAAPTCVGAAGRRQFQEGRRLDAQLRCRLLRSTGR